jgi:ABC-type branched-subunit amino acid transport system ATPase component
MSAILQVRDLAKRFGGLTAVAGLSFEVRRGEILGLIGPNGAGKSTTFNLIAGMYPPDAGEVRFEEKNLSGLAPHQIASLGVMRTFQHNRPFDGMTVLENVLVGAHTRFSSRVFSLKAATEEKRMRERAAELLDFVGLADLRDAPVDRLSFGQGRLLEIARALAGEPGLLLLDEPAAGLTLAEAARIAEAIRGVAARGIAVLLIEHDMHFLMPLAQRVVVLNFGAKIAEGTPEEVRGHPGVIGAYLGDAAAV